MEDVVGAETRVSADSHCGVLSSDAAALHSSMMTTYEVENQRHDRRESLHVLGYCCRFLLLFDLAAERWTGGDVAAAGRRFAEIDAARLVLLTASFYSREATHAR